jgi:bifunctional non-homologous end joining protein LigD
VHWVRPVLVAEVAFGGMTGDGLLRHPTFLGLRDDKPATEVRAEHAEDSPGSDDSPEDSAPETLPSRPHRAERSELAQSHPFTHPEKVLYPEPGITKRELGEYYELVAERMLPHVRNRPLTLVRCPEGTKKPCFFQKHPGDGTPKEIRLVQVPEGDGTAPYGVIDDVQGLFALVQVGALEIHTWGSHADTAENPDLLVLDLDPDPSVPFARVADAAHELRRVFEGAKLESFVKTTGGKGLHVCVPIRPELSWDEAKGFCRRIAEELVKSAPDRYVATASKSKRRGKIFIDYLRNGRGATFVAPFSTRARSGAPIALPLEWDEVHGELDPSAFTLRAVRERLSRGGADPFQRMPSLAPSLKRLVRA